MPIIPGSWRSTGPSLLDFRFESFFQARLKVAVSAFQQCSGDSFFDLSRNTSRFSQCAARTAMQSYQSMIARYEKRYSGGLTLSFAYTLSKLIASTAESNTWVIGPSNALYDPKYNRSIDANDTPHRLVFSHLWDLPFGKGRPWLQDGVLSRVLGNWQFSGITVLQAGRPILISAPDNTGLLDFSYTNGRADRLHSGVIDNPTEEKWFDTQRISSGGSLHSSNGLSQPARSAHSLAECLQLVGSQKQPDRRASKRSVPCRVLQHLQSTSVRCTWRLHRCDECSIRTSYRGRRGAEHSAWDPRCILMAVCS